MASDVKWIKIVTDIFDDEKIQIIEGMPEGDTLLVIWFKLICLAGKSNCNGYLYISDEIPYNEQMLISIFRRKEATIKLALQIFQQLKMIEIIDNVFFLSNFEKYQNVKALEELKEQNRLRVAKHRETKKLLESGNVTVTLHETLPSISISNSISKSNSTINNTNYNIEFEELWSLYPNKKGKPDALRHYQKHRKQGTTFEEVKQGIENYLQEIKVQGTQKQYIKHGSSWFNQACWNDEPNLTPPTKTKQEKATKPVPSWFEEHLEERKRKEAETKNDEQEELLSLEEIQAIFEERKKEKRS